MRYMSEEIYNMSEAIIANHYERRIEQDNIYNLSVGRGAGHTTAILKLATKYNAVVVVPTRIRFIHNMSDICFTFDDVSSPRQTRGCRGLRRFNPYVVLVDRMGIDVPLKTCESICGIFQQVPIIVFQ